MHETRPDLQALAARLTGYDPETDTYALSHWAPIYALVHLGLLTDDRCQHDECVMPEFPTFGVTNRDKPAVVHKVPPRRGGTDEPANLTVMHFACAMSRQRTREAHAISAGYKEWWADPRNVRKRNKAHRALWYSWRHSLPNSPGKAVRPIIEAVSVPPIHRYNITPEWAEFLEKLPPLQETKLQ